MIRLGRLLLVMVTASLLAALGAAWLVPVDGARFRPAIERAASRRLGAEVRIGGPILLRLLPAPTLEATSLRLALPGGGGTAQSLRLRVALGPLLAGRLRPRDLVLRRPRLRLPWPLPLPARLAAPEFSARVEDGALTLGTPTLGTLTLGAIDATLVSDPQTGTAALTGQVRLAGRPWRASASLTRPGGDGAAGLRLTLDDGHADGLAAVMSGQIAANGTLTGRAAAHGGDLSRLLPAPALGFSAEGRVTAAAGRLAMDDVSAEIDGAPVHGAMALRPLPQPRLDIEAAAARLDLDRWLAPAHGRDDAPLLRGLALGLAVSAEAATFSGVPLSSLRASLDADGSGAILRDATVVLPGEAPLRLAGKVTRDPAGDLRFEGDARLVAPDFAATRDGLTRAGMLPADAIPAAAWRSLDIAAAVGFGDGRLRLEQIRGKVDGSAVAGRLALRRAASGRLAAAAALRLDHLDLDPWWPRAWPSGVVPALDFELQLDAATASLRGAALRRLRADVGEAEGAITLRRLDAAAAGGRLAASGDVSATGRLSAAHLGLELPHLGALGAALARALPDSLGELPFGLQIAASGPPQELSAQVEATVGALTVTASPRLDLAAGSGTGLAWRGPLRLRAPSAAGWLASAGLGDFAWLGEGSLAVGADLSADRSRVASQSLVASLGELRCGGALQLDLSGAEPALSGRIAAERLPLPGLPQQREDPLPLAGLAGWQAALAVTADRVTQPGLPELTQASGELALAAGTLRLTGLRAQVAGGALTGAAQLASLAQPPRLDLELALHGAALDGPLTGMPVDLVAGSLDGTAALAAAGHSVAALLATVSGSAQLDVRDGVLQGIAARDLPSALPDDAVAAALAGGQTRGLRGRVALRLDDGAVAIAQARLAAPGVALGLAGSVDLAASGADLLWSVRPEIAADPELDLRLSGRLPALARSPELARLAHWRVGLPPH